MTNIAVVAVLVAQSIVIGGASQYAEGVMETVIQNRQNGLTLHGLPTDLAGYDGFIAVPLCDDIGKTAYMRPIGTARWERFLVADCAGAHVRPDGLTGKEWMISNNILVEVDYNTALRWGVVGRGVKIEFAWVMNVVQIHGNARE